MSFRLPGFPSKILSASGFFFYPAPMRAPPRLVPSFAIHITSIPVKINRGYTPFETAIFRA